MLRRIGSGRRYEALLVWDEHRLAVLVAKVLRPDFAQDPDRPARPRAARPSLPAAPRPPGPRPRFGAGTRPAGESSAAPCFPHLVLEHLDGPTLDELLAQGGPLAIEQLLPLGLHVASALHYLAGEGIVHLDVKPSNVVDGRARRA